MPLPRRDDERCGAALLAWVERSVRIQKELHAVRMPVKARRVQRSHALAVAPVERSCRPWAVAGAGPSQPRRRPRGRKASRPLYKRHPKVLHSALVSRLPGAWHTLPSAHMLATLTSRGRRLRLRAFIQHVQRGHIQRGREQGARLGLRVRLPCHGVRRVVDWAAHRSRRTTAARVLVRRFSPCTESQLSVRGSLIGSGPKRSRARVVGAS